MAYPIDVKIPRYTTSAEYRECLRNLFKMNPENYPEDVKIHKNDWDNETLDEMNYDNETSSKIMDYVYKSTKDNDLFKELYDIAAGFMISTDREVGLCVLFSYDYMREFHICIVEYLKNPGEFSDKSNSYKEMRAKLK